MSINYKDLIDAATWEFIRETESWYPPETASYPIAKQREIYDEMCRAFHSGYPAGVSVNNFLADNVPCRIYEKISSSPTVLYFHGGGFVVGGLESHDDICAEICDLTDYRVLSVDYRLCPEHPHPAAFMDCLAASRRAAENWSEPIILVGDSAGGNLAAAVSHKARGTGADIAGQVLIYPGLGGDLDRGSYIEHAHAPLLSRDDIKFYRTARTGGQPPPSDDPTCDPLADTDFSGLPPTYIITADCDPLRDDGRVYRDAICDAGGTAFWRNQEGLVHGFLRARRSVPRAAEAFEAIVDAVKNFGASSV